MMDETSDHSGFLEDVTKVGEVIYDASWEDSITFQQVRRFPSLRVFHFNKRQHTGIYYENEQFFVFSTDFIALLDNRSQQWQIYELFMRNMQCMIIQCMI
jgi:hypothetical protein